MSAVFFMAGEQDVDTRSAATIHEAGIQDRILFKAYSIPGAAVSPAGPPDTDFAPARCPLVRPLMASGSAGHTLPGEEPGEALDPVAWGEGSGPISLFRFPA